MMNMRAVRLQEGQLLKESIEDFIKAENITAATIISAVGSLSHVRARMAGATPDKQDIRDYNGSFEIVSLIGNLGLGRTHLHVAFSDDEGRVIGGHLKEGSVVHTTVELVLAVDKSLEFGEAVDNTTGFGELEVRNIP